MSARLLADDEPPAASVWRPQGRSVFLIVVDHAGRRIPRKLRDLKLPPAELERHIAWDIGALAVARGMSEALDATLVAQTYSRLVIDCNRDPAVASSIPRLSEATEIPGNLDLTPDEAGLRRAEVFAPYHERIRALLDAREASGRPTVLIAQHTMTDVYHGARRAMHAAVLYNRDRRFAELMLEALRSDPELTIADNQPYFVSDATDYTIPMHGERRGLPHVEVEIRQDLVADAAGQAAWAARMAAALGAAERRFFKKSQ